MAALAAPGVLGAWSAVGVFIQAGNRWFFLPTHEKRMRVEAVMSHASLWLTLARVASKAEADQLQGLQRQPGPPRDGTQRQCPLFGAGPGAKRSASTEQATGIGRIRRRGLSTPPARVARAAAAATGAWEAPEG